MLRGRPLIEYKAYNRASIISVMRLVKKYAHESGRVKDGRRKGRRYAHIRVEYPEAEPRTKETFTLAVGSGPTLTVTIENIVYVTHLATPIPSLDDAFDRLLDDWHTVEQGGTESGFYQSLFRNTMVEAGVMSDATRTSQVARTLELCGCARPVGRRELQNIVLGARLAGYEIDLNALRRHVPVVTYDDREFAGACVRVDALGPLAPDARLAFGHESYASGDAFCLAHEQATRTVTDALGCTMDADNAVPHSPTALVFRNGAIIITGLSSVRYAIDRLYALLAVMTPALRPDL